MQLGHGKGPPPPPTFFWARLLSSVSPSLWSTKTASVLPWRCPGCALRDIIRQVCNEPTASIFVRGVLSAGPCPYVVSVARPNFGERI